MEFRAKPKKPEPYIKRRCHRCNGMGREPCPICGGAGQVVTGRDVFNKPIYSNCSGCFGARTR